MKLKVNYSKFSIILTAIIGLVLFIGCIATVREEPAFIILLSLYLILFFATLFWAPAYVQVEDGYLILGSLCKKKKLPLSNIKSVEPCQPTMGAIRVCGSGGFMGYWGIFREGDIGRYYAFYGKSSDCFLVRMDNGDKYMVGCDDPDSMIRCIQSKIKG